MASMHELPAVPVELVRIWGIVRILSISLTSPWYSSVFFLRCQGVLIQRLEFVPEALHQSVDLRVELVKPARFSCRRRAFRNSPNT
jgi:hypothetical protein